MHKTPIGIPFSEVENLRRKYPEGTRIKLTEPMDDIRPMEAGAEGTVKFVDDAGQIHVAQDSGRSLALNVEVDTFEIIARP